MNKHLQDSLLWTYRKVMDSGLMNSMIARNLFFTAYDLYKTFLEAGPIAGLKPYASSGTTVIDVGANVGFFSTRFARWVVPTGGRVIALEPEAANFIRLVEVLRRENYSPSQVETLRCAVAERSGVMHLAVNPYHPGDHRLDTEGVPIDVVTIDALMAQREWPLVSLIKIDVQGAESRVLQGAKKTLEKFKPALFIELDDTMLQANGSSAAEILENLSRIGYVVYQLQKKSPPVSVSMNRVMNLLQDKSYSDFLFLHPETPSA